MWSARLLRMALVTATTVVIAAVASYWWLAPRQQPDQPTRGPILSVAALNDIGGPLRLTDHNGRPFDSQAAEADLLLVFFGFTHCPDVCPLELSRMTTALQDLAPADRARVLPVMVTVDPERDTPEHLAGYVALFDDRLVGLTGTPEEIAEAAAAFRVYYRRVDSEASTDYLMDHTAYVYLTRPSGETVALFPPGITPASMTSTIGDAIRR